MSLSKQTKQFIDSSYTTSVGKKTVGQYQKSISKGTNLSADNGYSLEKETRTGLDTYQLWLNRIATTLKWRQERYDKDWVRAYQMYNGRHWRDIQETDPSSDQIRDRITVNVTMSVISNILPFCFSKNPEYKCDPRKPETAVSAQLQAAELNYQFEQRNMLKQVDKAALDWITIGHGIMKIGYSLELDESISKADGEIYYEDYIKEDAPYIKRVCPLNFLIDPTASENDLETARWCAEIFFKNKRDVIANDNYNASVRNKIKSGMYDPTTKQTVFERASDSSIGSLNYLSSDPKLPESEQLVLFELWDKKYRKYYIFADNVPDPLVEKPWPYDYIDGFPYKKFDYTVIPDEIYPIGIPYTIEDQQFELNRVRTQEFERRRRFTTKYEVLAGVEEEEVNRLIEGEEGTVVRVQQIGSIAPIQNPPIPQDIQLVEAMIRNDIQQLTGEDQLIMGGRLPSRTTAGEVSTRTSLFRLKLDEKVKSADKFLIDIGTQVLQHIKNNFSSDKIVQLVGDQGIYWETLTTEMIRDEVDMKMETVSAPKVDPILDRQQRMQILQMASQFLPLIQAGLLQIDMNQIFKWVFESFGYKDVGRFFNPALITNQPLQEQTTIGQGQQQPNVPAVPPNASDLLQSSTGLQGLLNQSGLQLG